MSDDEQTRESAPDGNDRPATGRRRRAESTGNGHDPNTVTGTLPTLVLPTLVPPPRPPRMADSDQVFLLPDPPARPAPEVAPAETPAVEPDASGSADDSAAIEETAVVDSPVEPSALDVAPTDEPVDPAPEAIEPAAAESGRPDGSPLPEPTTDIPLDQPEAAPVETAETDPEPTEGPAMTSDPSDTPTIGRHQVAVDPTAVEDTRPVTGPVTTAPADLDTPPDGIPVVPPADPAGTAVVAADQDDVQQADEDIPLLTHHRAPEPAPHDTARQPWTGTAQQPTAAPQPGRDRQPPPDWSAAPQPWSAPQQSWPVDPAPQATHPPAAYPPVGHQQWPTPAPSGPRPLWRPEGAPAPQQHWPTPPQQGPTPEPTRPAAPQTSAEPRPTAPPAEGPGQVGPPPGWQQAQPDEQGRMTGPRLTDFLAQQAPPPELPATWGLRGLLSKMGMRMSPTSAELAHRQALSIIQRPLGGPKTIVVVNQKGGAGKTPATFLLAAVIGRVRGGFTLAWDNNENAGTLGWKGVGQERAATVVDLLGELERFTHPELGRVGDLDNFVRSQGDDRFDLLASNQSTDHGTAQIGSDDFLAIHDAMSRYYRVLVVDTGNNDLAPNWRAALDAADQIVVPIRLGLDYAGGASRTLDVLDDIGHGDLVRGAVAIVSQSTDADKPDVRAHVRDHFGPRVRSIVDVPFDPALVEGRIVHDALKPATRNAWIRAAAAVVSGL